MIDARIPLGVRPFRGPDPADQYQKALTMAALVGQQRVQEMQLAEAARESEERMTMREILRGAPNPEQAIPELYKRGMYQPAMALQKQVDERRKAGLESRKLEGEIGKQDRDALLSRLKMFGSAAAAAKSPQEFDAAMRALETQGVTGAANLIGRFNDRQALIAPLRDLEKIIEANRPKPQVVGDRIMDLNPETNPGAVGMTVPMTAAERDASSRGWAGVNNARENTRIAQERLQIDRTNNAGQKAPAGYRYKPDGTLEPIPGGPADAKAGAQADATKRRAEGAVSRADIVIGKVDEALAKTGFLSTGATGEIISKVPGTGAYDLRKTLDTIKANIGFQELQAMREASPTGGALGQVAVQEINYLQSVIASLDAGQSEPQLRRGLAQVKQHFDNWKQIMQRAAGGTPGATGDFSAPPAEQPAQRFDSLPDPAKFPGKTARNPQTGEAYRSDGKRWIRQ